MIMFYINIKTEYPSLALDTTYVYLKVKMKDFILI